MSAVPVAGSGHVRLGLRVDTRRFSRGVGLRVDGWRLALLLVLLDDSRFLRLCRLRLRLGNA
jgi:hypothetical protein